MSAPSKIHPVLLLLSGNVLGASVGGVFFVTASARLSLEDMGHYAVAISVHFVAYGLLGTGLAIATMRLTRDLVAAGNRAGAAGVVTLAVVTAGTLAIVAASVAYWGLRHVFGTATLAPGITALAVLWGGARAVVECVRSGILAQQQFTRSALLSVATAITGLTALGITVASGNVEVGRLLVAHVAGLSTGMLAGLLLLAPLAQDGVRVGGARAVYRYARWPALSEGTRLAQINLGAPLLVAVAGAEEAGLFGLGRYPAYLFDVVAVSLYQYWLARAVNVPGKDQMRTNLWRQVRVAGGFGAALVACAILTLPLLPLLGPKFASAGLLFVLSAADVSITLLARPIESAYHGLARPDLELLQRGLTLPVLLVTAVFLASRWGAVGMVSAHIIASLVSFGVGTVLIRRALRPALST